VTIASGICSLGQLESRNEAGRCRVGGCPWGWVSTGGTNRCATKTIENIGRCPVSTQPRSHSTSIGLMVLGQRGQPASRPWLTVGQHWPAFSSLFYPWLHTRRVVCVGRPRRASLYFDSSCCCINAKVLVVVATQVTGTVFAARSRASSSSQYLRPPCVRLLVLTDRDLVLLRLHCLLVRLQGARACVAPARGCVSDLRHISGGSVEGSRDAVYATAEPHIDLVREKRRNGKVQVASLASSGEKTSTVFIRSCCNISSSLRHDTTCQPPGHTCTLSSPLELASSITLDIIPTTWTHLRTELCTDLLLSDCLASVPSGVPLQLGSSATARARLRAAWRRKPSQQLDCTLRGCVQLLPTLHAILDQCPQFFVQQLAGLGIVYAILPGSQTLTHTKTSSFACR
jgi:hypothetical protein